MKIKYKTKVDDESYLSHTYKDLEKEFCCEEMKEAFEERFIIFGEADTSINANNDVNILKCSPYPEGAVWDEMAIKFCPFCGEKIETIEVKRVKIIRKEKKVEVTQETEEEIEIPIKEDKNEKK